MKKKTTDKNEQLSRSLEFNKKLTKEEKEIQASVMAGLTDEIDANSAFEKVLNRTNRTGKTRYIIQQITRVAAILAIPLDRKSVV